MRKYDIHQLGRNVMGTMIWDPTQFLDSSAVKKPFAILVLNQPINSNAYSILKQHACFTICADGGANRFFDLMKRHGRESTELPNAIVGDLDSINPEVQSHYESLNVPVTHDPDQYSTDFTKCLRYLRSNAARIIPEQTGQDTTESVPELDIVVLGGLGGRVDQAFSQIHHLYVTSQSSPAELGRPRGELYLISEESITFVLQRGLSKILTPRHLTTTTTSQAQSNGNKTTQRSCLGENIGILPVGGPAVISTKGLEWDVKDWKTEFGGQMSTSNHIRADEIEIETNTPVLFTAELAEWLKFGGKRGL